MSFNEDHYFLFAEPRVLFGVARTVDVFGSFDTYNRSGNAELADARALGADWRAAAADLWGAMATFSKRMGPDAAVR